MKVLIDTSVWLLALRRKKEDLCNNEDKIVMELIELINESRAVIIGPIRQEILSGISSKNQFIQLKSKLNVFTDFPIISKDYEKAAEFFSICKGKGVQGSHIDFLICSVAFDNDLSIFTTDKDFNLYAEHTGIGLHNLRK